MLSHLILLVVMLSTWRLDLRTSESPAGHCWKRALQLVWKKSPLEVWRFNAVHHFKKHWLLGGSNRSYQVLIGKEKNTGLDLAFFTHPVSTCQHCIAFARVNFTFGSIAKYHGIQIRLCDFGRPKSSIIFSPGCCLNVGWRGPADRRSCCKLFGDGCKEPIG